jgi:modulator of FtsH protease
MNQPFQNIDLSGLTQRGLARAAPPRAAQHLLAAGAEPVPTVLGAWLGVATNLSAALGRARPDRLLVGAFGFMFAIEKTKHSAAGVPVLLGFTFFMGLMLSRLIAMVLGFKNGPNWS